MSMQCGGAQRVVTTLANHWVEKGWQSQIVTIADKAEHSFYRLDPKVNFTSTERESSLRGFPRALSRNILKIKGLYAIMRRSEPNVVVSLIDGANAVTVFAARLAQLPVIISVRSNPRMRKLRTLSVFARRLAHRWSDAVVLQTERALELYPTSQRKNIRVIPNPVSPMPIEFEHRLSFANRTRSKKVIALGRLVPAKGFDQLIVAFAMIGERHPGWSLDIWGEGPERINLESLVCRLQMERRVRLPGITTEPIAKMLEAELFVLSSRWEGFPNVLCEAMACGLPVVSTDCEFGPREIITDGVDGLLVPPDDRAALSRAMSYLMGNKPERERLGIEAVKIRGKLSLGRVMATWENLIQNVNETRCSRQRKRA